MFTIRSDPGYIAIAEAGKATVVATTGQFAAGAKIMQFQHLAAFTQTGETVNDTWTEAVNDNRNSVSDLTVDATLNNERFSSSVMLTNATSALRLSQAFIVQSANQV